jgi:anti-anti-sigma regulatory factor
MKNSTFALNTQQTECAVLVMRIQGRLDGATFTQLIDEAQSLYDQNHRHLILDLTHLGKLSLAGLFGLHSVAAIFNGEEPLAPEGGWHALRTMKHDLDGMPHAQFKLSSPQPQVRDLLTQTGFDAYIDVFDDVGTAVASFANGAQSPTRVMA